MYQIHSIPLSTKGLVINYGEGGYKTGGGTKKGGAGKGLSHAEEGGGGGGGTSFEVVLTWELEVLAILNGGTTSFHPLKGGWGAIRFTLSRWGREGGGGRKKHSDPQFSHFVVLPLPVIN